MLVVRPARTDDVDALVRLAESAGIGLTTLPPDRRLLKDRVLRSVHALAAEPVKPGGEAYLFVMEDLRSGALAGTCGMVAKVGGFDPFYSYAVETTVHESPELGVRREIPTLHLDANHAGPTEIGTLFLSSAFRGGGNGRLLSLSRFLFMADAPDRFDDRVIAEMRGVLTPDDDSPFWEAVGRHFFDMEFARADVLSAADKKFIADLMPKHPIYIPMLPFSVQAVIGKVHAETRPALRLLEQEGFQFGNHVDIFDAGPLVAAERARIRTIRDSRVATVRDIVAEVGLPETYLVSNGKLDFRCCLGNLRMAESADAQAGDVQVDLPRDIALTLGVRVGERVRYAPARPA
jgi:arginine N-succinyltransferase